MSAPPLDWAQADIWPAPAKLNLGLRINARRPDGYHELQTYFQLLSYGDSLHFSVRDDEHISLDTPIGELPTDLCVRAAELLRRSVGIQLGVDIQRRKRLPIGGGVGGGSSNAATTLLALNQLWGLALSVDELAELGRQLGADVPVFVRGNSAFAEGVGEHLTPVSREAGWFLVITPQVHVSTQEIFCNEKLTRGSLKQTIRGFLSAAPVNDCEAVAVQSYPGIGLVLDWLRARGQGHMTGTGASCYTERPSRAQVQMLMDELEGRWPAFIAEGVDHSPVQTR